MGKKRKNQDSCASLCRSQKICKNNDNINSMILNIDSINNENEFMNSISPNVSRRTSNRILTISNNQNETLYSAISPNTFYLDLGDCKYICQYCGALF